MLRPSRSTRAMRTSPRSGDDRPRRSEPLHRGASIRVGPWQGDQRVGYVAPLAVATPCSVQEVRRAVGHLADEGYRSVVTAALAPLDQSAFLTAGFEVRERLHLLARDLPADTEPQTPRGVRVRRARRDDHAGVLDLDHLAFDPFWRLDRPGLADAVAATPTARFQVATADSDGAVVGYSIIGRAAQRGYVQRLAVAPRAQGTGLGRVLLLDGMRWLDRRRARRVMVNTQEANEAALRLYEQTGFERQPGGLAVLALDLSDAR